MLPGKTGNSSNELRKTKDTWKRSIPNDSYKEAPHILAKSMEQMPCLRVLLYCNSCRYLGPNRCFLPQENLVTATWGRPTISRAFQNVRENHPSFCHKSAGTPQFQICNQNSKKQVRNSQIKQKENKWASLSGKIGKYKLIT